MVWAVKDARAVLDPRYGEPTVNENGPFVETDYTDFKARMYLAGPSYDPKISKIDLTGSRRFVDADVLSGFNKIAERKVGGTLIKYGFDQKSTPEGFFERLYSELDFRDTDRSQAIALLGNQTANLVSIQSWLWDIYGTGMKNWAAIYGKPLDELLDSHPKHF